ncbi:MAG: glycoside hydrolase family 88 protein [Anaerocolumna aminovalerica]|jgi:rhamnogalacturonyl hydrolase YesR/O-antigen/teichoic acid export membrane protein|uniref:glycoside hydrolase family 88 protein n=1 Tax=Anaerocolumna aminovalerica TaxID=1527 RepID=UPI000BE252CF|nr:glycoside hydrolase family 88 protein [Anaerocolumna aminovalerica]MDU6264268.1 glycoside hydrolase family 88 protein [Anaerocolumna aminovalerica]
MGRIENAERNIFFGIIGNIVSFILGFISRTVFIHNLSVTYLGVNGLYTNILSVLSLAELGIGTAMNYSLYKPVAENNYETIKTLMQLYKKIYRIIAIIITVAGLILLPFLKFIIKDPGNISQNELFLYYLIFLFNTVSTYFVSYKYSLVNAEQKNYIQSNIQVITSVAVLISQIIILKIFKSFMLYLIAGAVIGVVQKVFVHLYLNKQYPYLLEKDYIPLSKEEMKPIKKNITALMYHKFGDVMIHQTDNIILSSFINVTFVGLLSNYNLIILSVISFINTIFNSLISGLGNLIALDSKEKQYKLFKVYRFSAFWIYGMVLIVLYFMLTPFITLWIGEDLVISNTAILLIMMDYYFKAHRIAVNNYKTAAGIFDADKYIALIQGVVNLIISILLVKLIGINGVFIGTIVSGLISNFTRPFIIYKIIFNKKVHEYYKDSFLYLITISVVFFICQLIMKSFCNNITPVSLFVLFILVITIPNLSFFILFRKREEFVYMQEILKSYPDKFNNINKFYSNTLLKAGNKIRFIKNKKTVYIKKDITNKNKEAPLPNDSNKIEEEWIAIFNNLRKNTRIQILTYPEVSRKQMIRTNIYSIIFTRKLSRADHFFWPNGLLALALECSYHARKDIQDFYILKQYYDKWIQNGIPIVNPDHAINGYSLIYVHQKMKKDIYKEAIQKIINYLYDYPRDKMDSIPYRKNSPHDIYIDSIGMICPFLCRYGKLYNDEKAIDLAVKQIINFIHFGFDMNTFLPYHGYNLKENSKLGIIGWGRGVGWLLIGMVDSLEYIDSLNLNYNFLVRTFIKIVETVIKYQKDDGYYSWQLTALEGHIDTSSTSMISYAIHRGVKIGILNKTYLYYSNLGLQALRNSVIDGLVTNSSAECMGFSMYPQRYDVFPWSQGPATALAALSLDAELETIDNRTFFSSWKDFKI